MLASLLIVFREVLEAGIIIGVLLAASRSVERRGRWIAYGIVGGLIGSGITALFAREIATLFDGSGQELLNAAILAVAVVMLAWTVVWMANHARQMTVELRAMGRQVEEGSRPLAALAIAVGMAVLREGAEVVLFLYSILVAGGDSPIDVVLGAIGGLLFGGAVSFAMYRGLIIIPIRQLFRTTSVLISLLAAGLAAQSVVILQSAGFLQSLSDPLWDTGWLLADDGWAGRVLHALVGYTTQPTGMQIGVQAATLLAIMVLSHMAGGRARHVREDGPARSGTPLKPS